jgi:adenine-specific DNA-methyltransferase
MPTLQFKGKNIIWNHHMSVPYHTLERVEEIDYQPEKSNGNLIVEGDNLTALKALLPEFGGQVKCIYIDPPYNTGEEHWIYNDKANSPVIREWIGKEVGKEDLTKHDKWLCMMTPRLKLLKELLSDDGVIFISIDENEEHHLRSLMDEIFGENNFIEKVIWNKRIPKNDKGIGNIHEYILIYSNSDTIRHEFKMPKDGIDEVYDFVDSLKKKKIPIEDAEKELKKFYKKKGYDRGITLYCNLDENYRIWGKINVSWPNASIGPRYDILHPKTKKPTKVPDNGWRYTEETFRKYLDYKNVKERYDGSYVCGQIWFAKDENTQPSFIKYLDSVNDFLFRSILSLKSSGKEELKELMPDTDFPHPKTFKLIKKLVQTIPGKDFIVLDSFAGSGTTGHAVIELNKEDGGNRRYIMVQMPENSKKEPEKNICKDITRERIVRAIEKYGYESGFEYLRVGQPLDAETLLSGHLPPYETFAKYVYYLATGEHLADAGSIDQQSYFVGSKSNQDIYLIYSDDMQTLQNLALNYEKAEAMRKRSGEKKIIIYAPACFLDEEMLSEMKIEFVSIPYNLFERNQEV